MTGLSAAFLAALLVILLHTPSITSDSLDRALKAEAPQSQRSLCDKNNEIEDA